MTAPHLSPRNSLSHEAAERLTKFCGMFSSHHAGERATAAAKADELVRAHGLTWADIVAPAAPRTPTVLETVRWILKHSEALNSWEMCFVSTLRSTLSPKQRAKLDQIVEKVRTFIQAKEFRDAASAQ
jgi:hypothetical protein